jgi:hypothetical protein
MTLSLDCFFWAQTLRNRRDAGIVVQPSGARVSSMVSSGSTLATDIIFECDSSESSWAPASKFQS